MPTRAAHVYCTCEDCIHAAGRSTGVRFPSMHAKNVHLQKKKLERDALPLEEVANQVFVSTLIDSSLETPGSKLWESRDDFQQRRDGTDDLLNLSAEPPIDEIVQSINRLSINNGVCCKGYKPSILTVVHQITLRALRLLLHHESRQAKLYIGGAPKTTNL